MFRYLVLLCASSTAITAQECNGDRDPSECSSLLDESSCGNYSLSLLCSRLSQSFVLFFFFLFLFHANRCASPRHECYHRTRAWLLFRQGCSWKGCGQTVPCDVQHLPFTSQLHSSLKSRYNLVIKTIHHHQYYPGAWETRTVAFLCNAKNNSPSSVLSRALTLVVFWKPTGAAKNRNVHGDISMTHPY